MPDMMLPPQAVIPHRDPFLLLTEVTEVTVGEKAVGYWDLTGDEPFFEGHFPGRPTLPGVLMCESIAQLGAYALLTRPDFAGRLALFGGLGGGAAVHRIEHVGANRRHQFSPSVRVFIISCLLVFSTSTLAW